MNVTTFISQFSPGGYAQYIFLMVIAVVTVAAITLPWFFVFSFIEKKLVADIQARVGPSFAGKRGWLQPVADLLKIITKTGNKKIGMLSGMIDCVYVALVFSLVIFLPYGSVVMFLDGELSCFVPLLVVVLMSATLLIREDKTQSFFQTLYILRFNSQVLCAVVPVLFSVFSVGIVSGGFSWHAIVKNQAAMPFSWNIFTSPACFFAFFVFIGSCTLLFATPPLGVVDTNVGDGGSFKSQGTGRSFATHYLLRHYILFLWSTIAVTLFLGAWNIPDFLIKILEGSPKMLFIVESGVLIFKSHLLMLIIVLLNKTSPRLRVDQRTEFLWKKLTPLALGVFIFSILWEYGRALL